MTDPLLSKIPFLSKHVDERFLEHRRRSTSMMGIVGALLTGGLLEYRLLVDHVIQWDLFAILMAMAVVKVSMMVWFRLRD